MDISHKMFLLAVEEMNFTKAAKKAFVTQQCLSEHIKNLEKRLDTKLFERSPRLSLTPSGQALLLALQKVSLLEDNLHKEIREIDHGQIGNINLGIYATRARYLLPEVIATFQEQFPQVKLSITLGDTAKLIPALLQQQLDLALGVDAPPHPQLAMAPTGEETLLLIATNSFLQKYYRGKCPWQALIPGSILDLTNYAPFPLVGNLKASTVRTESEQYLREHHIFNPDRIRISDYDTQLSLCRKNLGAMFSTSFMLQAVKQQNAFYQAEEPLIPLRLKNYTRKIQTALLYSKDLFMPAYLRAFKELLEAKLKAFHAAETQALTAPSLNAERN